MDYPHLSSVQPVGEWERRGQGEWHWKGTEKHVLDLVVRKLNAWGYHVCREIGLVGGAGRIDCIAWNHDEVLVLEIKQPPFRGGARVHSRELRTAALGLGQLQIYREILQERPGCWLESALGTKPELLEAGRRWYLTGWVPERWVLLLCVSDVGRARWTQAAAHQAGVEVWYWVPPGELLTDEELVG